MADAIYFMPKIRNTVTGQTITIHDTTGHQWVLREESQAQEYVNAKAAEFTDRTRQSWVGLLVRYTPTR